MRNPTSLSNRRPFFTNFFILLRLAVNQNSSARAPACPPVAFSRLRLVFVHRSCVTSQRASRPPKEAQSKHIRPQTLPQIADGTVLCHAWLQHYTIACLGDLPNHLHCTLAVVTRHYFFITKSQPQVSATTTNKPAAPTQLTSQLGIERKMINTFGEAVD